MPMPMLDYTKNPLVPPPPGQKSNFENPETRSPMAIGITSVMMGFAITAIILRFYARYFILKGIGADDWVGLAACALTTGYSIYTIYLFATPGMGPHIWDIPGIVFLKPSYGIKMVVAQALYSPCAYLIKLSILLLYRRVFISPGGRARFFIYLGIYGFSVLYFVVFVLSWAYCVHDQSLTNGGSCQSKGSYMTWALASVNVFTDMYILTIPFFVISKLHISTQRKGAVIAVFFVSLAATIASVVSVYYRIKLTLGVIDVSWHSLAAGLTSMVELNVGIVCSSVPAINVLFHRERHARNTGASYGQPPSKPGWSLNNLVGSFWTRTRTVDSEAPLSHDGTQSDKDIVKLIDIQQFSATNSKTRSPTASAISHSQV